MFTQTDQLPYVDPASRSEEGKIFDSAWLRHRQALQNYIDATTASLHEAIAKLCLHQFETGFVQDDRSQVRQFKIASPDGQYFFLAQYNPRRADRSAGAGRKDMPRGASTNKETDPQCFLCPDNIRCKQRGVQHYYTRAINQGKEENTQENEENTTSREYNFCCNPFPFGIMHVTVASAHHEPQYLDNVKEVKA